MEKDILGAKKLIETQIKHLPTDGNFLKFREYGINYFWTNENINGYLNLVDFTGKSNALSVLASGDQAFNLVTKGIMEIDTFDINALSEYIALGLKRAAILKFNYEEFRSFMYSLEEGCMPLDVLSDMIKSLLPYMDDKHRRFWREIIDYNYKLQKEYGTNFNLIGLFCHWQTRVAAYNNFLNKENYEILRSRLASANISFKCANAIDLPNQFSGKYDFILLSNILDYFSLYWGAGWTYEKLQDYERKLENITKNNGLIFLCYVFMLYNDHVIINGSKLYIHDLINEEVIWIPDTNGAIDTGMILKRVLDKTDK